MLMKCQKGKTLCYVRPVSVSLDPGCSGTEWQMKWQYEMNKIYEMKNGQTNQRNMDDDRK